MKNLQDIIPDRKITKLPNVEFAGIQYEEYNVETPVWSDQIQTLLENGYMVFACGGNHVVVNKALNPSPHALHQNKQFWRALNEALS